MGQEADCRLRYQKRTLAGKAYLETDHLLFRGSERLKLLLRDLTGVHAAGGILKLEFTGGPAEFDIGNAAEKWANKILHPPSRAGKLGLKAGATARLIGEMDAEFSEELRKNGVAVAAGRSRVDLVFFAAGKTADLSRVAKAAGGVRPDGALWVVYPKGVPDIREIEVIEAGRAAGLKDVKVASFSGTHTALKFVIPVFLRGPEQSHRE